MGQARGQERLLEVQGGHWKPVTASHRETFLKKISLEHRELKTDDNLAQGFYRSKARQKMLSRNVSHKNQVKTPWFMQERPFKSAKNVGKYLGIAYLFNISGLTLV